MILLKKQIATLLFLMVGFIMIAQTGVRVTYVKGLKKITDISNKSPKILKDISYSLIANTEKSIFYVNKSMSNDKNRVNKAYIRKGGGGGVYYKNTKTQEKLWQINSLGELFLIEESFNQYHWKLHKTSKKIGKYKCYKATNEIIEINPITKEKVHLKTTVWYTLDLPLPFGPAGYDGLPGLVITAQRGAFYFIANKIVVDNTINATEIKKPIKGKKLSRKEYHKELTESFLKL